MSIQFRKSFGEKDDSVGLATDQELIRILVEHNWDNCYEAVLSSETTGLGAAIMELDRRYGSSVQRKEIEEEFDEMESHRVYLDKWAKGGR